MRVVLIHRTRGLSKPCWSQALGDRIGRAQQINRPPSFDFLSKNALNRSFVSGFDGAIWQPRWWEAYRMAPYQHTYESAPTNQKKKDRLSAFLANFGETGRVLKALLALAKRQPDAASSPSSTRYSQPRLAPRVALARSSPCATSTRSASPRAGDGSHVWRTF